MPLLEKSLAIVESRGPAAVEQIYRDTLVGHVAPNTGYMLSLAEG